MPKGNIVKLMLLGDKGVGKRTLLDQIGPIFKNSDSITTGMDHAIYQKTIDGVKFIFQVWMLVAQDKFKILRPNYYQGAMCGFCVFDVTQDKSFINITQWIEELWEYNGKGMLPIILLGNKTDLTKDRSITLYDARNYANELSKITQSNGFEVDYMDISAKKGYNIDLAFDMIGKQIIKCVNKGIMNLH